MVSALVLVNTDLGVEGEVLESLKGVEGVEEAHSLYGVYDLVIKIKAMSIDKLRDIIKFRVRQVCGVNSLITPHADRITNRTSTSLIFNSSTKKKKCARKNSLELFK